MDTNETLILSRRLVLGANSGECERLYAFVEDALRQLPVNSEFVHDIKLVCEELLANIVNHGFDNGTDNTIEIRLRADHNSVQVRFADSGRPFNPLEARFPDTGQDLSEGGMGILLVKSLTDEQHYEHHDGLNVFSFTKNYNK